MKDFKIGNHFNFYSIYKLIVLAFQKNLKRSKKKMEDLEKIYQEISSIPCITNGWLFESEGQMRGVLQVWNII